MEVILASASPRRKELLKMVIPTFEVITSKVEEKIKNNGSLQEYAMELAYLKAKAVYEKTEGERIIIGADTIVTKNGKIYGKPQDEIDAQKMLKELLEGDRTHEVITGLTIIVYTNEKKEEYKICDSTKLFLKNMTDEEIKNWVATGKAIDKAGAYGIQDEFGVFVEKIEGNYYTVVGLPVHRVYDILKKYKN